MTHQEKLRKSLKWWFMKKFWILTKDLYLWAGKQLIKWSKKASDLDYENEKNN